jgi:hypothetical protein
MAILPGHYVPHSDPLASEPPFGEIKEGTCDNSQLESIQFLVEITQFFGGDYTG